MADQLRLELGGGASAPPPGLLALSSAQLAHMQELARCCEALGFLGLDDDGHVVVERWDAHGPATYSIRRDGCGVEVEGSVRPLSDEERRTMAQHHRAFLEAHE